MTDAPTFGLFTVDADSRTVRGWLVPWHEESRTSQTKNPPMRLAPDGLAVPRDLSVVTLNRRHDRFDPVGRLTFAERRAEGLYSEWRIADTDEGDEWLADHGDLVRLSPELKHIQVGPDGYGTAALTGAGLVSQGAWMSAGLFAVDPDEDDDAGDAGDDEDDDAGDAGDDEDDAGAAGDEDAGDDAGTDDEEDAVPDATVPSTTALMARQPKTAAPALSKNGFLSAMHAARRTGDATALRPYLDDADGAGLFALNNVTFDDANGLVSQAGIPNTWLGELAAGARFQRTVIPLLTQGVLRSLVATGWVWTVKPAMDRWAGNKTPIPSNVPDVGPKEFPAIRVAGGHDLAREFYDFGVTEVIDSYIEAMVDSYYVVSDDYGLEQLVAGATAYTPASATVGGQLAQMARAVLAARVQPTFALVAPDVFDAFTDVTHSEQSAYFSPSIGLDAGDLNGIPLIPDDRLAAGQAVVGSRSAATAWELPGVPIRVSAPDLQLGGVDQALFGYIAVGVTYPAGVVKSTITLPVPPVAAAAKTGK